MIRLAMTLLGMIMRKNHANQPALKKSVERHDQADSDRAEGIDIGPTLVYQCRHALSVDGGGRSIHYPRRFRAILDDMDAENRVHSRSFEADLFQQRAGEKVITCDARRSGRMAIGVAKTAARPIEILP